MKIVLYLALVIVANILSVATVGGIVYAFRARIKAAINTAVASIIMEFQQALGSALAVEIPGVIQEIAAALEKALQPSQ